MVTTQTILIIMDTDPPVFLVILPVLVVIRHTQNSGLLQPHTLLLLPPRFHRHCTIPSCMEPVCTSHTQMLVHRSTIPRTYITSELSRHHMLFHLHHYRYLHKSKCKLLSCLIPEEMIRLCLGGSLNTNTNIHTTFMRDRVELQSPLLNLRWCRVHHMVVWPWFHHHPHIWQVLCIIHLVTTTILDSWYRHLQILVQQQLRLVIIHMPTLHHRLQRYHAPTVHLE